MRDFRLILSLSPADRAGTALGLVEGRIHAEVIPMRGIQLKTVWGGVAASALLFTYGCGAAQTASGVRAQDVVQAQPAGSPIVVSCEPHQRTLVRPVMVNGAAVSQIECVAGEGQVAAAAQPAAFAPQAAYGQVTPRTQTVYADMAPAQVVPVSAQPVARPVRTRQVIYDEPVRVKKPRSVKKSAVIIGSSAAAGAGVGALAGGKKGALIGAAIGGGGAAIWDQITRRR
jgi:hypothetical protein